MSQYKNTLRRLEEIAVAMLDAVAEMDATREEFELVLVTMRQVASVKYAAVSEA